MPLEPRDIDRAVALWPELSGATARLINHSENQTFLIDTPAAGKFTLRVHRPGYQSRAGITSELAWLQALRRDTDLPIAEPIAGRDGEVLQAITMPDGANRHVALFRFVEGREPTPDTNMGDLFVTLGKYAARLHNHATAWQRPAGFERPSWQAASILDEDGLWGDWRIAPGVTEPVRAVLQQVDAALWRRLAEYGNGPDRFGLIHADMRLGNLLVDGKSVTLIDFDDCGFCWFAYDFAAAISFYETHPAVPALKASWLEGYQPIRALSDEDIAAIDSMVMLRRMALLAWIGSHAETRLAQTHMQGFAEGTAALGERYMRGMLFPK